MALSLETGVAAADHRLFRRLARRDIPALGAERRTRGHSLRHRRDLSHDPAGRCPPPPRAIFTSNPLRSLDWLLDRWERQIRPAVPTAELHVFSGPRTYGALGARKAAAMLPVLERARGLAGAGIVLREPVARGELAAAMRGMRVYLYRGDPGETFCASAGEAQAMGVPGVVQDIGSLRERIEDGATGFVARDADGFAAAAIRLLTDDGLWKMQHDAALATKRGFGWDHAAAAFERLLA